MFAEHPAFLPPEHEEQVIWRYIEFAKFVSMLATKSLFFSRVDLFPDKFEGSITVPNVRRELDLARRSLRAKTELEQLVRIGIFDPEVLNMTEDERVERSIGGFQGARWVFRMTTHICCWHMNDTESAAMWKLYSESPYAIAVKSRYSRLRGAIEADPNRVYIGRVIYTDYESELIDDSNALTPLLHKRHSFRHEQELRMAVNRSAEIAFPDGQLDRERIQNTSGTLISVDLSELVEEVVLSPGSPEWFADVVRETSARFDLKSPVRTSLLDSAPNL